MPTTMIDTNKWVSGREASQILTANSGHPVSPAYVRKLAIDGAIRKILIHNRMAFYNKRDLEGYIVKKRSPKQQAKDLADVLLEPGKVDAMVKSITEKQAKEQGRPLDEEEKERIREVVLATLVEVKETGGLRNPDEVMSFL